MPQKPNPIQFVKKKPVTTGLIVVGAIGIVWLASNGAGGSGGEGGYSGPSDAEIASNTQLQLAGMEATARTQAAQMDYAGKIAELGAQERIAAQNIQHENLIVNRQSEVAIATLGSQERTKKYELDTTKTINLTNQTVALEQGKIAAQLNNNLALISADRDKVLGNYQLNAVGLRAAADVDIAKIGASAQKSAAKSSMWGNIAGAAITAVAAFF